MAAFILVGVGSLRADETTVDYGDVLLSGGFQASHFIEQWELTQGDLVLSFKYNATGMVDDLGGVAHAWAELGLREVGYGDFNPTWMTDGAGVWLATDYDWTANTFDPDPPGAPTLDLDDKLILQRGGGMGEGSYDLPSTPPNPWANHRVWWDRDGVDPWQNDETANTGGIYEILITLHATTSTSGTALMNINGLHQGFETDGNWSTVELTPAGMTFTGDMTKMQVFYGIYGYGATHTASFEDITVTGHRYCEHIDIDIKPGSYPNPINLKSKGVVPVAVLATDDLDVETVEVDTVALEGAAPVRSKLEDVDGDGDDDLLLHFDTEDLGLDADSTQAELTGETTDGKLIKGSDDVKIVPQKGKK